MDYQIILSYTIAGKSYHASGSNEHLSLDIECSQRICVHIFPKTTLYNLSVRLYMPIDRSYDIFYSEGLLNTDNSAEYSHHDKMYNTSPFLAKVGKKYGYYGDKNVEFCKTRGKFIGYHLCYFQKEGGDTLELFASMTPGAYTVFFADLSNHTLSISRSLYGEVISNEQILLDITRFIDNYSAVFDSYLSAISSDNAIYYPHQHIDYSTKYMLGETIDEELLQAVYRQITSDNSPYNAITLDCDYASHHTDWLTADSRYFPHGLVALIDSAHSYGLSFNIRISPLLCHPDSDIAKSHRDMLILDNDTPMLCSPKYGGSYALDVTNINACNYMRNIISTLLYKYSVDNVILSDIHLFYPQIAGDTYHSQRTDIALRELLTGDLRGRIIVDGVPISTALRHNVSCYISSPPDRKTRWLNRLLRYHHYPHKVVAKTMHARRYLYNNVNILSYYTTFLHP